MFYDADPEGGEEPCPYWEEACERESCADDRVPDSDKIYVLARQDGEARCTVLTPCGQYMLHHVVRHSPTGIEWGYGGAGPADLALSILTDFGVENAEDLYQAFKRDVIADIPEAGGTISATDIIAWLREHES